MDTPNPSPARLPLSLSLEHSMEHIQDGFVVADAARPGHPILSVNPAFERMTGYTAGEVLGRSCSFLQGTDRDQPGLPEVRRALAEVRPVEVVLRNRHKSGRLFLNQLRIAPVLDGGGAPTHFVGVQRDVTEMLFLRKQLRQRNAKLRGTVRRLRSACLTDPLTGLNKRRAFASRLAGAWADAAGEGRPLSVLMIDIDWFKGYNDHHGHPAGDATLRRVAATLAAALRRGSDFTARYGGEEFVGVGAGMPAGRAATVAAGLCREVHGLRLPHGASPLDRVTISVGHATAHADAAVPPACLVRAADAALYAAKRAGRNRAAAAPPGAGTGLFGAGPALAA